MGGVGTMRSAAKVAGLGIISSYYGSCSSVSLAERVVEARNSVVPFSVSPPYPSPSPSAEQLFKNSTVPIPATVKISASSVRRPSSWEIIDWEFIAKEEGLLLETAMDHTPAISLGDVPSVDEALEATCDLRDALETLRFSPDPASGDRLVSDIQASNLTQSVIRKNESSGSPVFQAFSLMRDDPMIQNVVVSLASDKNIWDAVTKNKEFIQFCKRMNKNAPLPNSEVVDEESAENKACEGELSGNSVNTLMKLMQAMKLRMLALVQSISDLLQSIFLNAAGSSSGCYKFLNCTSTAATLMALTIATIMVVMVKRT